MIGNKEILAFDAGSKLPGQDELCYLDIWVIGNLANIDRNVIFMPEIVSAAIDEEVLRRDLARFEPFYRGKSVKEIHQYIVKSRLEPSHDDPDDMELFMEHQIMNWGENTDGFIAFVIEKEGKMYLTFQYSDDIDKEPDKQNIYFSEIDINYCNTVFKELGENLSSRL